MSCERDRLGKWIHSHNFRFGLASSFILLSGLLMRGDVDVGSDEGATVVFLSEFFAEITERLFHVAVSSVVNMLVRIKEGIILEGRPEFVSVVVYSLRVERSVRSHHVDREVVMWS
jgi:hypothetical protein